MPAFCAAPGGSRFCRPVAVCVLKASRRASPGGFELRVLRLTTGVQTLLIHQLRALTHIGIHGVTLRLGEAGGLLDHVTEKLSIFLGAVLKSGDLGQHAQHFGVLALQVEQAAFLVRAQRGPG